MGTCVDADARRGGGDASMRLGVDESQALQDPPRTLPMTMKEGVVQGASLQLRASPLPCRTHGGCYLFVCCRGSGLTCWSRVLGRRAVVTRL